MTADPVQSFPAREGAYLNRLDMSEIDCRPGNDTQYYTGLVVDPLVTTMPSGTISS